MCSSLKSGSILGSRSAKSWFASSRSAGKDEKVERTIEAQNEEVEQGATHGSQPNRAHEMHRPGEMLGDVPRSMLQRGPVTLNFELTHCAVNSRQV